MLASGLLRQTARSGIPFNITSIGTPSAIMSNVDPESHVTSKGPDAHIEHAYDLDEKAKASDFKADAIEAEQAEHRLGVLEAVRAYPMASMWAFIMSCTIVSTSLHIHVGEGRIHADITDRSWNPTVSS